MHVLDQTLEYKQFCTYNPVTSIGSLRYMHTLIGYITVAGSYGIIR